MCVGAMIYIPAPIPITAQTFLLFLALFTLGGRDGSIATLIYISIGCLGLPVFSGFSGGFSRILEPTGGYILGMLFASLAFWLFEKFLPKTKVTEILSPAVSMLVIYTFGTLWFTFLHTTCEKSLIFILTTCVIPFLIPDALKIIFARIVARKITAAIKE